ncbi:MAG: hypothetical protein H6718_00505 [Polyangiaceae bacterium]|nr:hypothetical protein [Polyangiaceae bacterium]MCB9607901.1 hypothetical protein [Polyangiaceae bacterium]
MSAPPPDAYVPSASLRPPPVRRRQRGRGRQTAGELAALREIYAELRGGHPAAALVSAQRLLSKHPENCFALQAALLAREALFETYCKRLAPLNRVAVLNDTDSLSLDHDALRLLSQLDGVRTLADILDQAILGRVETARKLWQLQRERCILLESPDLPAPTARYF